MIVFFDRSAGRKMGASLKLVRKFPYRIEHHYEYFKHDEHDDIWLAEIGRRGWMVVSQDYRHHKVPAELEAIITHNVGVFYLWGSQAPQWETFKLLVRSLDRMVQLAETTPRPFVYRVYANGTIRAVRLVTQRRPRQSAS